MLTLQQVIAAYARDTRVVGSCTSRLSNMDIKHPAWDASWQALQLIKRDVKKHELKLIALGVLDEADAQYPHFGLEG